MAAETRYKHTVLNAAQVPIIAGTTMKVTELALAYYWDHREELDREIERRQEAASQLGRTLGPSPLITRLQAKGLF